MNKNSEWIIIEIGGKDAKRQNDGNYTFTIDVENKSCKDFINLINDNLNEIIVNYITIEFKENFLTFNYTEYKLAISEFIS